MANVIVVRPVLAGGTALPVPYSITIDRDDQIIERREGLRDIQVEFDGLLPRVHRVRITADEFEPADFFTMPATSRVAAVAAAEVHRLCLVKASRGLRRSMSFDDLPDAVKNLLATSNELDLPPDARRQDERRGEVRSMMARRQEERTIRERASAAADGARRWDALTPEQQAGLLNLFAKMRSVLVTLDSGETISTWDAVRALSRVERDRIKAHIDVALASAMSSAGLFDEADSSLHPPPPGYQHDRSWKTREPFGNLQLTFFKAGEDARAMVVDADVDDAAGLAHVEQVARNALRGFFRRVFGSAVPEGKSHPYDIHQLVIHYQQTMAGQRSAITAYVPAYVLDVRSRHPFSVPAPR